MKVTIGGVTYEGSEEEVKRMVEWHKAQEPHVTFASGCRAADTDDVPISIRRILGGGKKRTSLPGLGRTGW